MAPTAISEALIFSLPPITSTSGFERRWQERGSTKILKDRKPHRISIYIYIYILPFCLPKCELTSVRGVKRCPTAEPPPRETNTQLYLPNTLRRHNLSCFSQPSQARAEPHFSSLGAPNEKRTGQSDVLQTTPEPSSLSARLVPNPSSNSRLRLELGVVFSC